MGQAEFVECPQSVAGLDDADPVHVPRGVLLHYVYLVSGTPQRDRDRQAADPSTDDEHPLHLAHAASLSYTSGFTVSGQRPPDRTLATLRAARMASSLSDSSE